MCQTDRQTAILSILFALMFHLSVGMYQKSKSEEVTGSSIY